MEQKLIIDREMLEGARDYVPLAEKRTFCREAAKLCLERLELETADGEAVPPVFRVNPWRRTRCLAAALCGLYLRQELEVSVDEDGVGWMVSEEEMDRIGGSSVQIGDNTGGTDRGTAATFNICQRKRITSIETVTIDGTDYAAVSIDNGVTFDTVAGVTLLSTNPYHSGWNDGVLGNDGSRISETPGKEPGLIQGTEFGIGAYQIVADELLNWSRDADNNYLLDIYLCDGQENAGGALTAHYAKVDGATLTFDESGANGWQYIQDMLPCGTNWPQAVGGGAGSSNGERAALDVARGSGVRASGCFGNLINGGTAGLAARTSNFGPGGAYWGGALGVPSVTG